MEQEQVQFPDQGWLNGPALLLADQEFNLQLKKDYLKARAAQQVQQAVAAPDHLYI